MSRRDEKRADSANTSENVEQNEDAKLQRRRLDEQQRAASGEEGEEDPAAGEGGETGEKAPDPSLMNPTVRDAAAAQGQVVQVPIVAADPVPQGPGLVTAQNPTGAAIQQPLQQQPVAAPVKHSAINYSRPAAPTPGRC